MFRFRVLKKSKRSNARVGLLETNHGAIETPSFVPVATHAAVKSLVSELVEETGTQVVIANAFHLHLKPGEKTIRSSGGLHAFMNWSRPIMTDSGGYQVFSLGFGRDLRLKKVARGKNALARNDIIELGVKPKSVTITQKGVYFRSPINGDMLFLGPRESIMIQERLGADIMFAFDECTPPNASYEYVAVSVERTHRWAKTSLETKKSSQALFGIMHGSTFRDLREKSADFINSLGFDGFGIGGDLGASMRSTQQILKWSFDRVYVLKPRHLLGIGHLTDIIPIVKYGVDLFDCTAPTHYARRGIAFVSNKALDLRKRRFLKDQHSLNRYCNCFVCKSYTRSYISHLIRANEITGLQLLTFHNLYYFNEYVKRIREDIRKGRV